jgi:L-aspartate oxidase
MGGVKTNAWGETNIAGLFASGETASTGVHGANRLASNSLLEVVVFAKRIIDRVREGNVAPYPIDKECFALGVHEARGKGPSLSRAALQNLMWDSVGIVRCGDDLERAVTTLSSWHTELKEPTDRSTYELGNMVLAGRLMAEAALDREESRGAHYRSDFPESSDAWLRHIVFRKAD